MTWRPLPGAGREPRHVGEGLETLARRLGAPSAAALAQVFARWPEAVGADVAAHSRPVSLVRGTLVVAVDGPAWATSLRYLGTDVLAGLEAVVGAGVVERVEVRVVRRLEDPD